MPSKRTSPLDKAYGHEVSWPATSALFELSRDVVSGFVYVIGEEDGGAVKIGVASDPVKRLRQMQTGNPRRLRIEYVLFGGLSLEKQLHEIWRDLACRSRRAQVRSTRSGYSVSFATGPGSDAWPTRTHALVLAVNVATFLRAHDAFNAGRFILLEPPEGDDEQ
jgi:hypothetical protein